MSNDKDIIRNMVMALANGDTETARQASAEVIAAKTGRMTEDSFDDETSSEDDSEESDSSGLDESSHMLRAARKHHRAGARDMKTKRDMHRKMHQKPEAGNEAE